MNTPTIPALPSTPIIKLTGPNGGGVGYQVGNLLILSGYGYKPLSGDGPSGFSPDFGLVDLQTPPAIQESEEQKEEEKPTIYRFWVLPRWTWDGCSNPMCLSLRHGYLETEIITDVGLVIVWKCRECNTLHRSYY